MMGGSYGASQFAGLYDKCVLHAALVTAWNALTDTESLALWKTEQTYKQAIEDARLIEESFYEARADAFTQFEAQKQSEFVALQQLWQSKEDAGYNVDA